MNGGVVFVDETIGTGVSVWLYWKGDEVKPTGEVAVAVAAAARAF